MTDAFWIDILFLFLNRLSLIIILFPFLIPIYTNPTGLNFVPPLGPAMPVIDTDMLALLILLKFLTIDKQHSLLTAPYWVIIFLGILRISIFTLFEYVTSPKLNTLEEPLTDVIVLDNIPPVQDSAKEILRFFFISFLTSLFAKFFIIKRNF